MRLPAFSVLLAALWTVNCVQGAEGASKVCFSCAPDYVPGRSVVGNKTLGELALISLNTLSDRDGDYMSDISIFCEDFHRGADPERVMREKIIPEMKKYSPNGAIDGFFIEAGCNPRKIGEAKSPMAHIAAESPTYRVEHLRVVKAYFDELRRPDVFEKIINAKNTKGLTTLDYVQHMLRNKIYVKEVEKGMNNFIQYLCENGAVYSIYRAEIRCDGNYIPVP
jgi:hypothetical protein